MAILKNSLIHSFPDEYYKLYTRGILTIDEFIRVVVAMADELWPITDLLGQDANYKFKGDNLEVLTEIIYNANIANTAFGLSDYTPVPISSDMGVDGIGINVIGLRAAVQVKFRTNPSDSVKYEEMAKTFTSAILQHGIPLHNNEPGTLHCVTTADALTHPTTTIFKKQLVEITRPILKSQFDGNQNFWSFAKDTVERTLM